MTNQYRVVTVSDLLWTLRAFAEPENPRQHWHDRRERMIYLWRQGLSTTQIAERLGMTRVNVGAHLTKLRKAGVPLAYRRAHSDAFYAERRLKMVALYNAGLTAPEVARRLGTTDEVVNTLVRKMRQRGVNIPYRSRHGAYAA